MFEHFGIHLLHAQFSPEIGLCCPEDDRFEEYEQQVIDPGTAVREQKAGNGVNAEDHRFRRFLQRQVLEERQVRGDLKLGIGSDYSK